MSYATEKPLAPPARCATPSASEEALDLPSSRVMTIPNSIFSRREAMVQLAS